MELLDNEDLQSLFPIRRFVKNTENDIVVQMEDGYMFRILAKGSEQSLRGLKWNGMRPKLIICDDMENDELVMNKDRREKFMRWIYGALIPCLAPDGKMRVVGTILHLDSFLEQCMPKDYDKLTVLEPLKSYSTKSTKVSMWKGVRYRAHTSDFSHILWEDRFPIAKLKQLQAEYMARGIPDVYSQEYLNYPLDPTKAYFRRRDFLPIPSQEADALDEGRLRLSYYIGLDMAISEKERADFTAYEVFGMDQHGVLYHVDEVRDRMDGREIIDTLFVLQKKYSPEFFAVESEKIAKALGPFLHEEMLKRGIFPNLVEITPSKDLWQRARSFQGRHRANAIKFDKRAEWYPAFEDELATFPRNPHDDRVASCAILGMALDRMVEAPTNEEVEEEEYNLDLQRSELLYAGRSETTGY